MKPLLLTVLAAYVVAAIHSILAFVNKRRTLERITLGSVAFGFVLHTISFFTDWRGQGHYPFIGLRETLSFLAWTLVVVYGLIVYRYRAQAVGTFTLPLVAVLTFIASVVHGATDPAALKDSYSAWLSPTHWTLLIFAYAAFFVVFIASIMYLLQERELKLKTFSAIFHRLPSLTTINSIATTTVGVGWTLLTLGILTGMIWSSLRPPDYRIWHNDPKEIFAALTWLLYLALVLYRATAGWRGRRAAWLGVAGFALVLFTFFGARLLGGYHVFG